MDNICLAVIRNHFFRLIIYFFKKVNKFNLCKNILKKSCFNKISSLKKISTSKFPLYISMFKRSNNIQLMKEIYIHICVCVYFRYKKL